MSPESDERALEAGRDESGVLRVLHVDTVDWLTRVREDVQQEYEGVAIAGAATRRDAIETLETEPVDCVVTAVSIPDFDLVDFLEAVASIDPGVPVVLYTGESPESAPDAAVDRADTILQRSAERPGIELLVRKIKRAAASDDLEGAGDALDGALGLVLLSTDGDVRWANEPFRALFPATEREDGRTDVEAAVAATLEDPAPFVDRRTEAIRDGTAVEPIDLPVATPRRDEERVVEYRSYPTENASGVGRVEQFRDVTREREFEAGQEKLETLETLVETARDGLYILDANGDFAYCNDSFAEMTGYEREELLGKHGSIPQKEGELRDGQRAIQRLLESDERESDVYDMVFETKDGDEWIGEINFALLPTGSDEYGGLVGVVRDVTERRRQEEQVRRQRERLEQFTSVVAHDLRNPLSLLQASLEGLEEVDDEALLEDAKRSADRMDRMIDDLLELSSAGQVVGDPEPVDLEALVGECWHRSPTADAALHLESGLGAVAADRSRLAELLENLFRNAIEHGSTDVTVTVGPLADGDGFYVADDGPGIPDDEADRVFDHGFTTDPDGTGFGLSIVAEIVEAHGWSIAVADAADGGARFEIETDSEG